jgi:heat shock protein 1/8
MHEHCVVSAARVSVPSVPSLASPKRRWRLILFSRLVPLIFQSTSEPVKLLQGQDFSANITRARFEEINAPLFKSTLEPVEKVLKDAKIAREKVDDIVLVGGSTRIPKIQSLVSEYFGGRQLNKSINPDEAVAYGAAVQAAILTGQTSDQTKDLLLLDVAPLSLGVAMQGDVFGVVVPRNTPIPTNKSRVFTTVEDNQTTVTFPVYVFPIY